MTLVKDPQRFENIASGVNKIVLTIAVIVGGCWSLFVYRDVARREALKAQSNLIVRVEAAQLVVPEDPSLYIRGIVEIRNAGTRNTIMILPSRGQVEIARVDFDKEGRDRFTSRDTTQVYMWADRAPTSKTSLMGGMDDLPFVQRVSGPGVYLVSFSVLRDSVDVLMAGGNGPGDRKLSWTGATYVVVSVSQPSTAGPIRGPKSNR